MKADVLYAAIKKGLVIHAVEMTVCQVSVILEETKTGLWNNIQSHFLFWQK